MPYKSDIQTVIWTWCGRVLAVRWLCEIKGSESNLQMLGSKQKIFVCYLFLNMQEPILGDAVSLSH